MANEEPQFDFGDNWKAFSEHALTAVHVEQAKKDFIELLNGIDLRDRSFLDIGFGQGLTLLAATSMGACTVGCDINPTCVEVLKRNRRRFFPGLSDEIIPVVVGSILEDEVVESLRVTSPDGSQTYQIVHAWGVLHHTGEMERAIRSAAALVAEDGYFIISIYGRHWSSPAWNIVKAFYNRSPATIRRLLIQILYPLIYLAKWMVTRRNPLKQSRGMDFYYDVVDWVGGYPYEYATVEQIKDHVKSLGFTLEQLRPAAVPTGCNEFVFRRDCSR